tara:strand:- start:276 stop:464 length:189 start_codon:yes stop_codon:yes gene_type:complete
MDQNQNPKIPNQRKILELVESLNQLNDIVEFRLDNIQSDLKKILKKLEEKDYETFIQVVKED